MTALMEAPPRSLQQRRDALERANEVRVYRAKLKRDLYERRVRLEDVLASDDPMLATMTLFDLLLATPKVGRVKATKVLSAARISPGRTLSGLTDRQRRQLGPVVDFYIGGLR